MLGSYKSSLALGRLCKSGCFFGK